MLLNDIVYLLDIVKYFFVQYASMIRSVYLARVGSIYPLLMHTILIH